MLKAADELYMASSEDIRNLVQHEGRGETLYVCGHNPGISDLACRISGENMEQLPTLGVVIFHPDSEEQWETLNWGSLAVRKILSPRNCRDMEQAGSP